MSIECFGAPGFLAKLRSHNAMFSGSRIANMG